MIPSTVMKDHYGMIWIRMELIPPLFLLSFSIPRQLDPLVENTRCSRIKVKRFQIILSGRVFLRRTADLGCDPKYFFGDLKENTIDRSLFLPILDVPDHRAASTGYTPASIAEALWSPPQKKSYTPPGGWGIIPSRAVEISNLPKSTQLWTLVELLKVVPSFCS
jgi:hypothetical protein